MKAIVLYWFLLIGSSFFAGLRGFVAFHGHPELRRLRAHLAAEAVLGLLLGIGAITRLQGHWVGLWFLWLIAATFTAMTVTMWLFVLGATGSGKGR